MADISVSNQDETENIVRDMMPARQMESVRVAVGGWIKVWRLLAGITKRHPVGRKRVQEEVEACEALEQARTFANPDVSF